jgi:hypothetical protein
VIKNANLLDIPDKVFYSVSCAKTVFMILILSVNGATLLKYMKNKYYFAYTNQSKSIKAFMIAELFGEVLLGTCYFA